MPNVSIWYLTCYKLFVQKNELKNILVEAFNRKKARNPSYSRSALARDIGVSSAFVSNVLTAKKNIPLELYDKLCFALELDSLEKNQLTEAFISEKSKKNKILSTLQKQVVHNNLQKTNDRQSTEMSVNLLTHWYYLAVLEILSTTHNTEDQNAISQRLGLSDYQFNDAIDFLSSNKLITKKNGLWFKNESHLYFPVGRSKQSVRRFHKQMIEKAKIDLETKTSEEDFSKRTYLGFTFSANPNNVEKIKAKIQKLLSDITIEAGEGECTEVYQCNLQLFPLTGDKK